MDNNNEKVSNWLLGLNAVLVFVSIVMIFIIQNVISLKNLSYYVDKNSINTKNTKIINKQEELAIKDISVIAESAYVYDLFNKKVLYQKNPNLRFSSASTAKIMTALTSLEYFNLNDSGFCSSNST